uniref:CNNM transmembrane domain-containing protein n=1 Tax=Hydatigena taeniaeformis TaxID=6205 RepID=A0A0R3WX76_HYDTA
LTAPITVELKTKAPGARTFLQVVRARFGTPVHCLFLACALLVNLGMSFEICSSWGTSSYLVWGSSFNGEKIISLQLDPVAGLL